MDPFLGEVRTFPWNFAPRGWALCNGASLPISQNAALYSLLGTTYGGDGRTTFNLPDLQGRTPIHFDAAGQTSVPGQKSGTETVSLVTTNLPAHTHAVTAVAGTPGSQPSAVAALPAKVGAGSSGATINIYAPANAGPAVTLAADSLSTIGGGGAHNNMQPFLALNFCIAVQGIFPTRS